MFRLNQCWLLYFISQHFTLQLWSCIAFVITCSLNLTVSPINSSSWQKNNNKCYLTILKWNKNILSHTCINYIIPAKKFDVEPNETILKEICVYACFLLIVRPKKKNCYVALSRPTVKCEKTGSDFFFFMSDLGEEFAKICIQWLKKALAWLVYMRFDCIPPEFSPFRNFKKNIGKLNSLTVRKKKKKKIPTDRPNFQILVGWGQHNNFFFLA